MATKKEIAEFETALEKLSETRPDLAEQLGSTPTRADIAAALELIAPAIAPGLRSASRPQMLEALSALAPAPQAEPLVSFTTRLPRSLVAEVKAAAVAHGGIQTFVKAALEAYLKH